MSLGKEGGGNCSVATSKYLVGILKMGQQIFEGRGKGANEL